MKEIHSLGQLLSEYDIVVPMIQRDYVQGSNFHAQKRDMFVKKLVSCLESGEEINLDFIYGVCDEKKKNQFMPLDGQQRLTTLFLLRWLMLHYVDIQDEFATDARNYFSYQIRRSSESFCKKMISETFHLHGLEGQHAISSYIKAKNWFVNEWDLDPTIRAMLDMLDAVYTILPKEKVRVETMLDNFDRCIHFDILDMKNYHLSDSLYVKMNERGKQLTDFENWKAAFIGLLDLHHKNAAFDASDEDRKQCDTLAKYFEHSIEHQWTDLLWTYAFKEWEAKDDEEKKRGYPTIDKAFMNLFKYYHEIIFFSEHPQIEGRDVQTKDFENSLEQQAATFGLGHGNHVIDLYTFLDTWSKIDQANNIDRFFDEIDLRLWGKDPKPNLFRKCISDNDFDIRHKILLFALTEYCSQNACYSVTDDLRIYMRVCRNLVESINQFVRASVSINTNVRVSDWNKYATAIKRLSSEPNVFDAIYDCRQMPGFGNIQHEIEKHEAGDYEHMKKWEDLDIFKGNLSAILPLKKFYSSEEIDEAIDAFLSATCTQKVQLLVAFGYKGVNAGWCMFGNRHFFGSDGRWDVIFSYDAQKVQTAFMDYVRQYKASRSVSEIIGLNAAASSSYSFRYYVLKYDAFAEVEVPGKNPCFYYAWMDQAPLEIIGLTSYSQSPLLSYHSEPFAAAVATSFKENELIYSQIAYVSRYNERASLYIDDKNLKMSSHDDHWSIEEIRSDAESGHLQQLKADLPADCSFCLTEEGGPRLRLASIQGKDLVETGIDFIQYLFNHK